jgi:predicted Kef-type K+ transport protein
MRVKWVALVGAPTGILLIVGIAATAAKFLGWSLTEGVVIGATISLASTMVVARLLSDTGKLTATYGRVMIGITLVEDLAVICMTVILPVLWSSGDVPLCEGRQSFSDSQQSGICAGAAQDLNLLGVAATGPNPPA